MNISYDLFTDAFLSKITEFEFVEMDSDIRTEIIDEYLIRAVVGFRKNCLYDFTSAADNETRSFSFEFETEEEEEVLREDLNELIEIISEGMVVQWLKPYVFKQENLEAVMNSRDFTTYSPANLLKEVSAAYKQAHRDYTQMIREYSYNHGNLAELHL